MFLSQPNGGANVDGCKVGCLQRPFLGPRLLPSDGDSSSTTALRAPSAAACWTDVAT